MFSNYFEWWVGEISELLAPNNKEKMPWDILLYNEEDGIEIISKNENGKLSTQKITDQQIQASPNSIAHEVMGAKKRSAKILSRVSTQDVLKRTITIPTGARDVIHAVVKNQIERMVPWTNSETYFGYEVTEDETSTSGKLKAQIIATNDRVLRTARSRAQSLGIAPTTIDYAAKDYQNQGILLSGIEEKPKLSLRKKVRHAVATYFALATLAGGFAALTYWQRVTQLEALSLKTDNIKGQIARLDRSYQFTNDIIQSRNALIERKNDQPPTMIVLEALARVLPDDTYLSDLIFERDRVVISGKSNSPTALIEIVERAPQFSNARFVAATTSEDGSTNETFSIEADAQKAPLSLKGAPQKKGAGD